MCNFYKKINKFFKEIFVLIFLVGAFGIAFGIIYSLYLYIFNDTTINSSDDTFIIEYIFICIGSFLVGFLALDGNIKTIKIRK